jgi:hypothetical protein
MKLYERLQDATVILLFAAWIIHNAISYALRGGK